MASSTSHPTTSPRWNGWKRFSIARSSSLLLFASLLLPAPAHALECAALRSVALSDTTVATAESVAAGAFVLPADHEAVAPAQEQRIQQAMRQLPAFCRITAVLTPTPASHIRMEVWLPASGWNGRFLGVGNGGWGGAIPYQGLAPALLQGFATAATDDGTGGFVATDHSTWTVLESEERLIDFGWRATHLMTTEAKMLVHAFYSKPPDFSYWNACSTGGKQGLTEAQRFPADYDGVVEGDPANNFTHLMFGLQWFGAAARKNAATPIPPEKFELLHDAVLKACDAADGVADGVLGDPESCRFDLSVLACKGKDGPDCLNSAQLAEVQAIYSGAHDSSGQQIFPGEELGSELGWTGMLRVPGPTGTSLSYFQGALHRDLTWQPTSLNFDGDLKDADARTAAILNAVDPNLEAFRARGGKLILYHGWSDPIIVPGNSVRYYQSVVQAMGGAAKTEAFARLFMVPGMNHCGGGPGTDSFDKIAPIEDWRERGIAPDLIFAAHNTGGAGDFTRPLCPWPRVAQWDGKGDSKQASNFTCHEK